MQHIDEYMDDQFREAANAYPLKTAPGNWDDIAGQFQDRHTREQFKSKNNLSKYRTGSIIAVLLSGIFSLSPLDIATIIRKEINYQTVAIEKTNIEKPDTSGSRSTETAPESSFVSKNEHIYEKDLPKKAGKFFETGENSPLAEPGLQTVTKQETRIRENDIPKFISAEKSTLHFRKIADPTTNQQATAVKGPYLGFSTGVQFSQVKNQGFSKAGFSGGLVAGYRFGKRFSAETGLQYSFKKYHSDGAYFDMSKASGGMPANMQVISLEGRSSIFEIPLKLKYDFISGKKSAWFVTTGFSYYLLTNESNDYLTMINGNKQQMKAQYTENKKYAFAALHLSAGYEITNAKKFNIRLEPYIQIPLKKMGIGSMPIMTAGLQVGILKNTR